MVVDQKAAEKSRRLSKNGSVSTQTERKRTAYGKQGLQSIQFTNGGSRAYLKCRKAYDIMPVGKKDVSAHVARIKPRMSQLRGFSIPFWVGGLIPRLATSYSSPSSHLQM